MGKSEHFALVRATEDGQVVVETRSGRKVGREFLIAGIEGESLAVADPRAIERQIALREEARQELVDGA